MAKSFRSLLWMLGFLLFLIPQVNGEIAAQQKEISGIITDSKGETIVGASISVKGTTIGTVSDYDGKYLLSGKINPGEILVFSFMGMETKEVIYNGQSQLSVNLKENVVELQEFVVVGYNTQKRGSVTGAVSSIDSKKLSDVTSPSTANMLQGKAAGVNVIPSSGQPGAPVDIIIRGKASMSGSVSPLWVIDGVIYDGTPNLNPNDIENIAILKDASATSLYGSRGANGVIVVSTKQAKTGTSRFDAYAKMGVNQLSRGHFKLMNTDQLISQYQGFQNQSSIPTEISSNYDQIRKTNFNWFDEGIQLGKVNEYGIAYSTGTDKTKAYISTNYYDEDGAVKGFNYQKFSARINLEHKVNNRLTLKPKVYVDYSDIADQQLSLYDLQLLMPWDYGFNEDGSARRVSNSTTPWYSRDASNPFYNSAYAHTKRNNLNLIGNFDLSYKINEQFQFISTNNLSYQRMDELNYVDPLSIGSGETNNGTLAQVAAQTLNRFTNQMLKYNKEIKKHAIGALIAYEYNDYSYQQFGAQGKGMVTGNSVLNGTSAPIGVSGMKREYALQSGLFNGTYSYDGRYLAQASYRYDGASNVGINNQYGGFFSISGGWNIQKESFFNVEWVNELKLRGSYGSLGNRPSDLYPYHNTYSTNGQYNGVPTLSPSQYGNPDLKWEKSYQADIALDTRIFDRVSLSIDYYNIRTSDLLFLVSLPAVTGYRQRWQNVGGVENNGLEITISADLIKTKDFQWAIDFNYALNRNKVTGTYENQNIVRSDLSEKKIITPGSDIDTWYMRKWAGVDPQTGKGLWYIINEDTGETSTTTNYNEASLQQVGTSTPKYSGGIGSSMSYKNWNLTANFAYSKGAQIYNAARELYDNDGAYADYNQMQLADGWTRWKKPGDIATHPALIYGNNTKSNKTSSRYLEDGSYFRMRNLKLQYTVPSEWTSQLKISNVQLYFTADNLFTLTNFSGLDPEARTINAETSNGLINRNIGGVVGASDYPITKHYVFGINLSF